MTQGSSGGGRSLVRVAASGATPSGQDLFPFLCGHEAREVHGHQLFEDLGNAGQLGLVLVKLCLVDEARQVYGIFLRALVEPTQVLGQFLSGVERAYVPGLRLLPHWFPLPPLVPRYWGSGELTHPTEERPRGCYGGYCYGASGLPLHTPSYDAGAVPKHGSAVLLAQKALSGS